MLAVYKRELKSYFHSFIGFLFVAVTMFFIGFYYYLYLGIGSPYFANTMSGISFLFLLNVPLLTMKVLADERKNKTDQLVLTSPVSVLGIVVGKYLALLTIFAIPVLITCTYPLIMCSFGDIPLTEAYLAIFGYFLFGACAIAVGVFISSITESQVIAAVLSFLVLFVGYIMSSIVAQIPNEFCKKILGSFDLQTHYMEMLNGALNIDGVVYYLTLSALFIFFTVQSIQKRRYTVSLKNFSMGAYSVVSIAVAVAIVVFTNYVVDELPVSYTAIDVTNEKLYSLTDQTKDFLDTIDEDVSIYVLSSEDAVNPVLKQSLVRYDDYSDYIKVEYVDPTVNPRFAMQFTSENVSQSSIIVAGANRNKIISPYSIFEYSDSALTGYDGEGQITSAISYVLSEDVPVVYITQGHGEASLSSTFLYSLSKENVAYETINLMDQETIPDNAACVFINAPSSDLSSDDTTKLKNYINEGGKVILVTCYTGDAMTNIESLMDYMGMKLQDGLVVEQNESNYYMSPFYLLPNMNVTSYTSNVAEGSHIFAPFSQGITLVEEGPSDVTYSVILFTSDNAYVTTDFENVDGMTKSEEDAEGTFSIAIEAKKAVGDDVNGQLVVYGSSEIFTDQANEAVSGSNLTVFTSTIGQFVEHEVSVSVPVKKYEVSKLIVPQASLYVVAVVVIFVIPLAFLVAGFAVWGLRRKR